MFEVGAPVVTALLAALAVLLASPWVLRRLSEPPPDRPDAATKIPYVNLATRRFATTTAILCLGAALLSGLLLSPSAQPPWLVLATVGVLLAVVDAETTWLPRRLTYAGWAAMALAVGLSALLGADPMHLVRAIVGAVVAGGLYLFIWRVSRGGFGFGDVRYAPLLGAATGGVSLTLLLWALTLGSVAGAVDGIVRLARGRRGEFAYAPSMLAGCYLALLLQGLLSVLPR